MSQNEVLIACLFLDATTNQQSSSGVKRTKQRKSSIQNPESAHSSSLTTPGTPSATNVASAQAIDLNNSGNQKNLKRSLIFKVCPHKDSKSFIL